MARHEARVVRDPTKREGDRIAADAWWSSARRDRPPSLGFPAARVGNAVADLQRHGDSAI